MPAPRILLRIFLLTMLIAGAAVPLQANDAPCLTADQTCEGSLAVNAARFQYFRTYALSTPNPLIQRAVIVIHGEGRNAPDYFSAMVKALRVDSDPSVLVIAPHFKGFVRGSPICADVLEPNELHWSCEARRSINRWDNGGQARDAGPEVIYSFSMIDRLLMLLDNRSVFPKLEKIIIVGHSDGGQFTQRYAAGNQSDGAIHASVKYVIANPGSYMYLDEQRLPKGETCSEDGTCTGGFTKDWDPDRECSDAYNNYKYGLAGRTFGYMASLQPHFSNGDLATRFVSRAVAYLVGELDQFANSNLDTSCAANAQGSHLAGSGLVGGRRERGVIFWNYIRRLGAAHTLTVVPRCGHDERCMLSSPEMISAILDR